ncbi:type III pantothenate kinase [bacterium]|nr:type III pantothenate kinase [bacterium]
MLLTIDVGNTSTNLGIFDKDKLIKKLRISSDRKNDADFYEKVFEGIKSEFYVSDCIIASVVDEITNSVKSAADKVFRINSLNVTPDINTGNALKMPYKKGLGADRIVNAYWAAVNCQKPVIVVDMGTATTLDIINKNGEFIGGVIAAGIKTQLKALHDFTSKLPELEPEKSDFAMGTDTKSAIMSGVIRGSAYAIDGLIKKCEEELGKKATVVATGGYCELLSEYTQRKFDLVNPDLTLDGLRLLYELNKVGV